MEIGPISLNRSITSYTKVQAVISKVIRNNPIFIKKTDGKVLLNVGCGPFPKPDFINLDWMWHPSIDICWNIATKPLPLKQGTLEGIYTEHCLEHIPFESCLDNLRQFHSFLKPGGTVRIVVPDAEIYFDHYQKRKADRSVIMPYGENEETGVISINRIFRGNGHQFIYDYETMSLLLQKAGFTNISKCSFRKGADPRLLIDRPEREVESLYVEAIK